MSAKKLFCSYEGCCYATNNVFNLERHAWTHFDVKGFRCDVVGCEYQARGRESLKQHLRKHKVISLKSNLNCKENTEKNTKKATVSKSKHKCNYEGCNYSSPKRHNLLRHRTRHSQVMRFRCLFKGCGYVAKRRDDIANHVWIHTDVKRYKCKVQGCKYRARHRASIKRHIEKHH